MKKNPPDHSPMVVFVVQEENGGIPDEPVLFLNDEKAAERHYIKHVNEYHHTNFKSWQKAYEYMRDSDTCWDKWGIRLWECSLQ